MRPEFLYWMTASLLIGVAWAAVLRRGAARSGRNRLTAIALAGVTVALLCVGVVSHTLMRHVVQATPAAVALAIAIRRPSVRALAAIPILTFWLGLMILIWLFLLDAIRLISGHFSTTEIALTIVIAIVCGLGLVGATGSRVSLGAVGRVGIAALVGCLQLGALVLSMQPWAMLK